MSILTVIYLSVSLAVGASSSAATPRQNLDIPARAVQPKQLNVAAELRPALAAVSRITTGMQTELVCKQLDTAERKIMNAQLKQAVNTLHSRLVRGGIPVAKSQQMLVRLMDDGEKLAKTNFPTCTKLAPEIIVKATQDAACINPYLDGTNTACFR